jgi:hypothetical protein
MGGYINFTFSYTASSPLASSPPASSPCLPAGRLYLLSSVRGEEYSKKQRSIDQE